MFSIGDQVVHPMHGAGVIDDIVQERIMGEKREYYVFKMPVGGLVLKIPVANSQIIGIREVISCAEAETLLETITSITVEANTNWNKRYQENMQRLKSGDLMEVARVIKCLMLREAERGLSTGERKLLHSAKQIFISEVVLATQEPYQQIESRLQSSILDKGA